MVFRNQTAVSLWVALLSSRYAKAWLISLLLVRYFPRNSKRSGAFFAKYLLDYDASANILSWQWCAGTGIDPQPYFRIFNPYSQSLKFDKEALYIKRFLPQLSDIPSSLLHKESYLLSHTIPNYPRPIIEHEKARKRFLNAFAHTT